MYTKENWMRFSASHCSDGVHDRTEESAEVDHCELTHSWSSGVRIRVQQMTATVRLHSTPSSQHLTVVCCGPPQHRGRLFYFQVSCR